MLLIEEEDYVSVSEEIPSARLVFSHVHNGCISHIRIQIYTVDCCFPSFRTCTHHKRFLHNLQPRFAFAGKMPISKWTTLYCKAQQTMSSITVPQTKENNDASHPAIYTQPGQGFAQSCNQLFLDMTVLYCTHVLALRTRKVLNVPSFALLAVGTHILCGRGVSMSCWLSYFWFSF